MKYIFVIITFLIPLVLYGQVDTNHFNIKIEEWNSSNSNQYIFTDSNIKINRTCSLIDRNDCFEGRFYARQLNNLTHYLSYTNLDSIKARYSNNNVDGNFEYDFTIIYGNKKTIKHIYMTEYYEYIKLVELLNDLIPDYFAIDYDYNYIHGKQRVLRK